MDDHRPSEDAVRRAREAGFELEELRESDPTTYRMLCAVPVLRTASELRAVVEAPLRSALPGKELFEAKLEGVVLLLAFPGPAREELQRLDEALGAAAASTGDPRVYYRVVTDRAGTRRELLFATEPAEWSGQAALLGPFEDEGAAIAFGERNVAGRSGITYDALPYGGHWFCDVFAGGEA